MKSGGGDVFVVAVADGGVGGGDDKSYWLE
jgi:hypothetical protein